MDLRVHSNERGDWIPNFSRPLNHWEIEVVKCLFLKLPYKVVIVELEDKVCWLKTKSRFFFYYVLEVGSVEPFPENVVYNAGVSLNVSLLLRR